MPFAFCGLRFSWLWWGASTVAAHRLRCKTYSFAFDRLSDRLAGVTRFAAPATLPQYLQRHAISPNPMAKYSRAPPRPVSSQSHASAPDKPASPYVSRSVILLVLTVQTIWIPISYIRISSMMALNVNGSPIQLVSELMCQPPAAP
jgi:hypothetical protein